MAIADRKEREFKARETLAIEHADELLLDRGYLGLNLDELADRIEYSKATLYHHFQSKEDLVLAVVLHHLRIRTEMFRRAVAFDARPRERMFAVGIADRLLNLIYPHSFPLVQLVRSPSIWSKCAPARQGKYFLSTQECFAAGMEIAESGVSEGDFEEWSPAPDQILWGLISLSKGAHLISEENTFGEAGPGESEPLQFLYDNYHRFLDGMGWRPFTRHHDYEKTRARVEAELFSDEVSSARRGS